MAPPKLPGWIEVFTSSVARRRMFTWRLGKREALGSLRQAKLHLKEREEGKTKSLLPLFQSVNLNDCFSLYAKQLCFAELVI